MGLVDSCREILKLRWNQNVTLEIRYRCDGIGCARFTNKLVKERWNVVHRLNPDYDNSTFHFCTVKCMVEFFCAHDWKA